MCYAFVSALFYVCHDVFDVVVLFLLFACLLLLAAVGLCVLLCCGALFAFCFCFCFLVCFMPSGPCVLVLLRVAL